MIESMGKKTIQQPSIGQYKEMKYKHHDAIIMFRVGGFYEVLSEDAVIVSDILGITLCHRQEVSGNYVELAGFPHHAIGTYLPKLIRAGKRVVICDHLE